MSHAIIVFDETLSLSQIRERIGGAPGRVIHNQSWSREDFLFPLCSLTMDDGILIRWVCESYKLFLVSVFLLWLTNWVITSKSVTEPRSRQLQRTKFVFAKSVKRWSFNNPKFNYYINVIYPEELEIKDTTDAPQWANYLELRQELDEDGRLYTDSMNNVMNLISL